MAKDVRGEAKAAQLRGELVEIAEVESFWRGKLRALPNRILEDRGVEMNKIAWAIIGASLIFSGALVLSNYLGRYSMAVTHDGVFRVDKITGEMIMCTGGGGSVGCLSIPTRPEQLRPIQPSWKKQ